MTRSEYFRAWRQRPETRERLTHGISRYTVGCRCDICRDEVSRWKRADRRMRIMRGQCTNCSAAAMPDRQRCARCLAQNNKARKR